MMERNRFTEASPIVNLGAPIKKCFNPYISGEKPEPSYLDAMQYLANSGTINNDIMKYAQRTLDAVEDEKKYGSLKDDLLSTDHAATIRKWTEQDSTPPFYESLTSSSYQKDRSKHHPFVPIEWKLMKALEQLEPYAKATCFRAVAEDLADKYEDGREVTWHAPASATETMSAMDSPQFVGEDGQVGTIFNITLTQKQARLISKYSAFDEGEVLLPPGSRFRVTSKIKKGQLVLIHLEEIPSNDWILDLNPEAKESEPAFKPKPRPGFPKCEKHDDEPKKVCCAGCGELSCRECILYAHKDHKRAFANNKFQEHRPGVQKLLDEIAALNDIAKEATRGLQEAELKLTEDCEEADNTIDAEAEACARALQDRVAALKEKVRDAQGAQQADLQHSRAAFEAHSLELTTLHASVSEALDGRSDRPQED